MYSEHNSVKIVGMAAAVSSKWDSLRELSEDSEAVINKFIRTTGVEGRYSASPKQCTSDFCFAAAEKIITEKNIDRDDIGVLVFVTQSSDYRVPATACVLQYRLRLSQNCIAFDVNLGCSGYTNGINILCSLMECSDAKYGLLLAGDTSARELSQKSKNKIGHSAALLFGDSGTATLFERESNNRISVSSNTDGEGFKAIIWPYGSWRNPDLPEGARLVTLMDEIEVFNFATAEAPKQINEHMIRLETTPDDYNCLVLHQANLMIMKRIAKKTGFPMERVAVFSCWVW